MILSNEPTGNLDSVSADEALNLLSLLSRKFGNAVVMVTHDPHAASYANVVYHLKKGCLLSGTDPTGRLPSLSVENTYPGLQ